MDAPEKRTPFAASFATRPAEARSSLASSMINVTPYHVNRTRLYYENLHKAYRSEHATNALNPPIFSRAFCGGGNGNGPAFRQDVRSHVALPLSSHHADAHVAVPSRR